MTRATILLICLLVVAAICSCQKREPSVSLGECPLKVEVFPESRGSFSGFATVSINGMSMGGTSPMGAENDRYGAFDIKLAPGKYEVTVAAEGYEPHKDTVNLLGKEYQPFLRVVLKPTSPASPR